MTPYYAFSFKAYHATKLALHQSRYEARLRTRAKLVLGGAGATLCAGLVYPLMMYIEYDINVFKPRVSEYILNRLS